VLAEAPGFPEEGALGIAFSSVDEWRCIASGTASGRLDLQNLGTEVGKDATGGFAERGREVEDANGVERPGGRCIGHR